MIEMNVDEWLNKLESNITLAKKSFMSDMKLVDESACLECIAQIRSLLPSELSEARLIRKDAQNIVANAQNQASKTISDAQNQAAQLVSDNKIVENANIEANKILQSAQDYANNMVGQAYNEVGKLMDDAEAHAREILQVVIDSKKNLFPAYDQPQDPSQQY